MKGMKGPFKTSFEDKEKWKKVCESNLGKYEKQFDNMFSKKEDWTKKIKWKVLKKTKFWRVDMATKLEENGIFGNPKFRFIRGHKLVKTKKTPADLLKYVFDGRTQPKEKYVKYDPGNVYYDAYWTNDEGTIDVCHVRQSAQNVLVADRDFVVCRKVHVIDDKKAFFYGQDVCNENDFLKDKCVRGYNHIFFWEVTKVDNDTLECFFFLHVDPKGWIPAWVFNLAAQKKILEVDGYTNEFCADEKEGKIKSFTGKVEEGKKKEEEGEKEDKKEEKKKEEEEEEEVIQEKEEN